VTRVPCCHTGFRHGQLQLHQAQASQVASNVHCSLRPSVDTPSLSGSLVPSTATSAPSSVNDRTELDELQATDTSTTEHFSLASGSTSDSDILKPAVKSVSDVSHNCEPHVFQYDVGRYIVSDDKSKHLLSVHERYCLMTKHYCPLSDCNFAWPHTTRMS